MLTYILEISISRSKVYENNYPLYLQIQLSGISIKHNSKSQNGSLKAISIYSSKTSSYRFEKLKRKVKYLNVYMYEYL